MEKKKVIVYGLGNALKAQKYFIKTQFSIVGYSDTSYHSEEGYIKPEEIAGKEFDYIYVTSTRYFSEIRTKLVEECKISEDKIISLADVLGDFDNAEVRRKWIIQRLKEIPAGKLLLDAGAGEMQYKPYCDHLKYIAQDFGQYDPAKDWGGVSTPNKWDTSGVNIVCDIVDMPLESESVDVILCSEIGRAHV